MTDETEETTEAHAAIVERGVIEAPLGAVPAEVSAEHPDGWGEYAIVHRDYEVARLDGPRESGRAHEFSDLETWTDFVREKADPERCEILVSETMARAIFDPRHVSPEMVQCSLRPHPLFAAWSAAFGKRQRQRDCYRLLRGLKRTITDYDAIASTVRMLGVSRTTEAEIHLDATGRVSLRRTSGNETMTAPVPEVIHVRVPVFRALPLHLSDMEILVEVDTDDGIALTFHCPELEVVVADALTVVADSASQRLNAKGAHFLVGIGEWGIFPRRKQ